MRDGNMYLIAVRQEAKTLREWQRLVHTNLKNWKCEMPAQSKGWMKLITAEEYDALRDVTRTKQEPPTSERPNTCRSEVAVPTSVPRLRLPVNLLLVQ